MSGNVVQSTVMVNKAFNMFNDIAAGKKKLHTGEANVYLKYVCASEDKPCPATNARSNVEICHLVAG